MATTLTLRQPVLRAVARQLTLEDAARFLGIEGRMLTLEAAGDRIVARWASVWGDALEVEAESEAALAHAVVLADLHVERAAADSQEVAGSA